MVKRGGSSHKKEGSCLHLQEGETLLTQGEWGQSPADMALFPNKQQLIITFQQTLGFVPILSFPAISKCSSENNCLQRLFFAQMQYNENF